MKRDSFKTGWNRLLLGFCSFHFGRQSHRRISPEHGRLHQLSDFFEPDGAAEHSVPCRHGELYARGGL